MRRKLFVVSLLAGVFAACAQQSPRVEVVEGNVTMADGVNLYYRSVGNGPDVLVVPLAVYLQDALLPLAANRRVIFYDPRNRGRAESADLGSISIEDQIADLEALRQELGINRMALLGWSALGMEMAVYTLRYPQRVSRLIQVSAIPPAAAIMDSHRDARQSKIDQVAIEELARQAEKGVFDERRQEYCRRYNALTLPASLANAEFAGQVADGCSYPNEWPENLGPYFRALAVSYGEYDWRQELKFLRVPRLIIHGQEDRVPVAGAYSWANGYPEARLLLVSPSGHFPFIEQRAAVLSAMETFLSGDWPDGSMLVTD